MIGKSSGKLNDQINCPEEIKFRQAVFFRRFGSNKGEMWRRKMPR